MTSRRRFLKDASLAGAASITLGASRASAALSPLNLPQAGAKELAADEAFWGRVAARYRVDAGVVNLEAGYFGLMALPVIEAFHRNADRANSGSSYFARREFPAIYQSTRQKVAAFVGAKVTELTLSRNATEALQALIGQYNKVGPGDTVMYADLDYNAMQWAMNELAARRGAHVATLDIPEPASHDGILAAYKTALDANPRTKLLLLTHCNNKTGLLLPVKEIVALARPRGIDVVVDAAHSFGHVPLTMAALDAEFVGLNLHKWVGAPIGVGAMYIREDRLASIDHSHGDITTEGIESRLHTGTVNMATVMTVPASVDTAKPAIHRHFKTGHFRQRRDQKVLLHGGLRAQVGVDFGAPASRSAFEYVRVM